MKYPIFLAALTFIGAGCSGSIGDTTDHDEGRKPSTPGGGPDQRPSPNSPPEEIEPDQLFTCGATKASSPSRVWRLSATQFENTVRQLSPALSKDSVTNPFAGAAGTHRFENYAESFGLPGPIFDRAFTSSEEIASRLLAVLPGELPCVRNPDAACAREVVAKIGARAFRRPLTSDESSRYERLIENVRATAGDSGALALGLQALLQSPHFLFRMELGEDKADGAGRKRLTHHEIASAIAYAITDAPPDAVLAKAANDGALGTIDDVRAHLVRLMGEPSQNNAVHTFLRQYLKVEGVQDVFKDPKEFAYHTPAALLSDTDEFVKDALKARKSFLKTLLTADWGYVGPKTAMNYNLEATAPKTQQRMTMPTGQRAGILTQPAFLAAFSANDHNDPIVRGKFIAQSFLCLDLPNTAPMNVPPLPDLPNATMREKLQVHSTSDPSCRACHSIMDGIGMGLEMYDHTGRYRTMEGEKSASGAGEIVGTESDLDGPFDGAIELSQRLAGSDRVEQCFLRHSLRFFLGRDEANADACTLANVREAWKRSDGDLAEAVVTLLASDSFLYRSAR